MILRAKSSNNNKCHILCISPLFAPLADSEAICSAKLINQVIQHELDVTVLCREIEKNNAKTKVDTSSFWKPLKSITVEFPDRIKGRKILAVLYGLRYHVVSGARSLAFAIARGKELYYKKPYDLIYSRSNPVGSHIMAYWIAKKFSIPWIANINDPWDGTLDYLYLGKLRVDNIYKYTSLRWMKIVLKSASCITYPNERLAQFHVHVSGMEHHYEVIPHIGYRGRKKPDATKFILLHAGRLGQIETTRSNATTSLIRAYSNFLIRNPEARPVTNMFLVGPEDLTTQAIIRELNLCPSITSTGWLNYEESLEHIANASVCILVEGPMKEGVFLPSKLADYIAARKPILALSPEVGVVSDMHSDPGIVRVDVNDESAIENAIDNYYLAYKQQALGLLSPSEKIVNRFKPEVVGNQFLQLVNNLLESSERK
jgi:glycosyltransferase involved in cell wall biosynthesis